MINKLASKIYFFIFRAVCAVKSSNNNVDGNFKAYQPVVIRGKGHVKFGNKVNIGVINSPLFYNTYAYIEARSNDAVISFGNNININNSFSVVSEKSITIEDNVLIGYNCSIIDSDFHDLEPSNRNNNTQKKESVLISKNVFIGNNVSIFKGVTIGENSVVAASSVVTKSFPSNVVVGGNPAKIIKTL
ncbi:maltose O-acetyltransferase [Lacinutrix venerupis]|uniref:acyltransferase n=1 Tax=Lacinutrix venerupis TaxID=1486034 RepID=UPI000EAB8BBA|nr:acyltransferase [Lacinutrix venerupis]RLJ67126.1 maltose O-acetyltransferase [Lacinutrix venerupis]